VRIATGQELVVVPNFAERGFPVAAARRVAAPVASGQVRPARREDLPGSASARGRIVDISV